MNQTLEVRNLTKRYGTCVSVHDVSLMFEPGRIHAVLGENGAGKTTLMKLLFGMVEPTSGEIWLGGRAVQWKSPRDAIELGLGMVQQHFTLVETLSAIDNIMLGAEVCSRFGHLNRQRAIVRLEKLLPSQHLAVPWHALVKDLTVGQKQRLEILKLLFRDSQILFLDEPTAVLAPAEIEDFFTVLRQLKAQGRTIILITHKINEVLELCDTYSILREGKLQARENVTGVGLKTSVDDIVEKMIGRKIPQFLVDRALASERLVLDAKNLRTMGARADEGVSLNLHAGEIVGIAGVEGSGQTQIVDVIMGLKTFAGELEVLETSISPMQTARVRALGTGFVPEDRHAQALWLTESCHVNMAIGLEDQFVSYGCFRHRKLREWTTKWAVDFDVRSSSLQSPVDALSGGNQQKIIFAREVSGRKPKLLICHQPTRGVDLGAIDLIHRRILQLRNEGVGVLVISSDLDELLKLCDRLYVMFDGKVGAEFTRENFDVGKIGQAMTGVTRAH